MRLTDIAARLDCVLKGDGDMEIAGVAGIEEAEAGHLTFVSNPRYAAKARTTKASAVIVSPDFPDIPSATLRSGNPYLTFAHAVELFYQSPEPARGVDDCTIHPFVHISRGARIGDNFKAYAHVSVREFCRIGNNVILQDGAKIGADGFGYAKKEDGSYYKIVQSGIVVLEDDVEVGANATVDRATIGETRVRRGVKMDNLVQVGHASDVGEDTLLCAQVGLAGSSKIGRSVILTGQVGVAGHLEIGDRVVATAQSGIPNSIEPDKVVSGYPAIDNKLWLKSSAVFKRLPELLKRIDALEKK